MSGSPTLDIRLPIGGLFTILGLLLAGYGFATAGDDGYARSFAVNVNLWWGLAMLVFGALLLWSAARGWGRGSARPATGTAMGQETEIRERERGLER